MKPLDKSLLLYLLGWAALVLAWLAATVLVMAPIAAAK